MDPQQNQTTDHDGSTVPYRPDGVRDVTPWVVGHQTAEVIDWMVEVFGAVEQGRVPGPDGTIAHAEVRIGDALVMLFDLPDWPPTPALLRVYTEDVHALHSRAEAAGGTTVTRPTHMPWGTVGGRIADPYGNLYWTAQQVEVVDAAELERRQSDPEFVARMAYVMSAISYPRPSSPG